MKKIILIRHGRAEEPAPEITDFERSLTVKGKLISKLMARQLKEIDSAPGTFITSPAFRAIETAYIFAGEFGIKPEKVIINSIIYYKMNFHYLTEILSLVTDDTDTVTLFGHNPSFTEIAGKLMKDECDFIPKCGIVGISFNISSWSEIKQNSGKLQYFLKPDKAI